MLLGEARIKSAKISMFINCKDERLPHNLGQEHKVRLGTVGEYCRQMNPNPRSSLDLQKSGGFLVCGTLSNRFLVCGTLFSLKKR